MKKKQFEVQIKAIKNKTDNRRKFTAKFNKGEIDLTLVLKLTTSLRIINMLAPGQP